MRRIRMLAAFAAAICACMGGALMCTAGTALAAHAHTTPTPFALDVPNNGAAPNVVYDPVSQTTFVAWTDPQETTNGAIDLCVLPAGATACAGSGPQLLTVSSTQNPDISGAIGFVGLTVLPNGDVVVAATGVYGGTVAWESGPSGSAFEASGQGLQNGGGFVSPINPFYDEGKYNIIALSDTDIGVYDDEGGYFSDSPFAGPESPYINGTTSNGSANVNPPPSGQSSSLYPGQPVATVGSAIAAEPAPAPAAANTDIVVAVGDNSDGPNTQLSDCVNGDDVGTGYGVDVGSVTGSSKASGTLNYSNPSDDAAIPAFTALSCNAQSPTVASPDGGTQGIGLLEDEGNGLDNTGSTYTLDYRPFTATATSGSFGSPVQVAKLASPSADNQVVDDTTDGVYAFWDAGGYYYVSYSSNNGTSFGPPVQIPGSDDESNGSISAVGGGTFLYAFTDNTGSGTQTFIEGFSYQALEQAPTTLTTSQTAGGTTGADITVPAGTVGESDTATLTGTNATTATGTVDFALYNNATCSGTPVYTGSAGVSGATASVTDSVTPALAAGTYYWTASYDGDTLDQASSSSCGSEILTVSPAPSSGTGTGPGTGSGSTPGSASGSGSATATGTSVTVSITCTGTCTVTLTITVPGTGTDFLSADKKKVLKPVIIAKETLTIGRGKHAVKLRLTAAGRRLIKKHSRINATLTLVTKTAHGFTTTKHALKITRTVTKKK